MGAASMPIEAPVGAPRRSKRLLAISGDERLVAQIRGGNEAAFEVVFERYSPAILAFCRHMLGSREEGEDAAQHAFAAAYSDLRRGTRGIALKPWLFTIARNRCVSILRARRETPTKDVALATAGLAEQVERRAELRLLLADLRDLPDEQRAALLLAEVGDLSHADVARVLGCEVSRVKALVYRARSGLIARRAARETPCEEIREQLANLRGGSLRRTELRLHLHGCPGCRAYRAEVRRQRDLLAAALPVTPTLALKANVLTSAGVGGATAGGGGAFVAKVAVVSVLAGAGVAGGQAVVSSPHAPVRDRAGGVGHFMGRAEPIKRPTPLGGGVAGAAVPEPERSHAGRGASDSRGGHRGRAGPKASAPERRAAPGRKGAVAHKAGPKLGAAPKRRAAPEHKTAPGRRAAPPQRAGAPQRAGPKPRAQPRSSAAPKLKAPKAKAAPGASSKANPVGPGRGPR